MNSDLCTPTGAHHLKARIEAFWRERGHAVSVTVHDAGFMPSMRSARTDVRSDLKDGWPPALAAAVARRAQRVRMPANA